MSNTSHPKMEVQAILRSDKFDPKWYISEYADVGMLGMDPAEHYVKYGKLLGRKPYKNAKQVLAVQGNSKPATSATMLPIQTKYGKNQPFAEDYAQATLDQYKGPKTLPRSIDMASLPLVSFVMTSHNAEATIDKAVISLLNQTYPKIEIIVCDDKSSDRTWEKLRALRIRSPNALKIFRVNHNGGTYLAKNIAVSESSGEIVLFQDSDDYSHPDRALVQVLPLLNDKTLRATRTKYLRFSPETKRAIPIADMVSKYGLITLAVRRNIFDQIGYFDAVRKAGDDEWFQRFQHLYGKDSFLSIDVSLYLAELRENSLVSDMMSVNADGAVNQSSSKVRKQYVQQFKARFEEYNSPNWYKDAFPIYPKNPNQIYPQSVAALSPITEKVFASACCIPSRTDSFKEVVSRILPQVDGLYVFLDKFDEIPEFLKTSPKIHVTLSKNVKGDPRDNAKFFAFNKLKKEHESFYYVTCDDDIIYPHDYVRTLISQARAFENQVIIGLHGVMYEESPTKYFKRRFIYHFRETPLFDRQLVNNLGTGTVAFHSNCFDTIDVSKWHVGGMVDIFFSKECRRRKIPMVCIDRHENWMTDTEESLGTPNLFTEFREKEEIILKELKSMQPWGYHAIEDVVQAQVGPLRDMLLDLLPKFSKQQKVSTFFPRYR